MRHGRSKSFKVIKIGTSRKPICDFLLVFHCNCMRIFYRFRNITISGGNAFVSSPYFSLFWSPCKEVRFGPTQWLKWKIRGEGTVYQLWAKMGPQQVVRTLFMKFEVWERWISITGGAGTAFPCVQWHFNHWTYDMKVGVWKRESLAYPMLKTARSYGHWFWRISNVWRTDRQTDWVTRRLSISRVVVTRSATTMDVRVSLKQEAQLSQRDRSMLRVIKYFARSLKGIKCRSKWHSWEGRKSVLVFRYNYVAISYSFWDIQRKTMH